jgi:hypothetical protein
MAATNTSLAADERGAYGIALSAATVDTVTFAEAVSAVEVISDGTAAIYVTVDGTAPTSKGKKTYEIPAAGSTLARTIKGNGNLTQVKLLSAGTPTYSVSKAAWA